MDAKDLVKRVKEDGVKFVSLQFNDVTGTVKSVDMPIRNLDGALEDGVWFDGSSVEGFARIQESDMLLRLDPDTYAVLPWSLEERRRARKQAGQARAPRAQGRDGLLAIIHGFPSRTLGLDPALQARRIGHFPGQWLTKWKG